MLTINYILIQAISITKPAICTITAPPTILTEFQWRNAIVKIESHYSEQLNLIDREESVKYYNHREEFVLIVMQ